jgi:transposase
MARWIQLASEWLKPIYRQIKEQMMRGSYIQVDETPIRYLDPGNGKTGQGYLWVAHRPGEDVLFEWYTTREAKCLDKLIPSDFSGTIQCDGYSAYDRFARHRAIEGRPVLFAGCWAHARRGFYEALDHAPKEAGWVLIQIGHLYDIERNLRRQGASSVFSVTRCLSHQSECAHLQTNPACPTAVVHHPPLPAQEHDGQSRQLHIGPMGSTGSLP